ncbi:MAG: hypothetical protein GY861_18460 [bacterium]|nr:hypothetical protein [bacterium]
MEDLKPEEIRKALASLEETQGWKIYKYIITRDEIEPLHEELASKQYDDLADVRSAQERVRLLERMMETPSDYINSLASEEDIKQ